LLTHSGVEPKSAFEPESVALTQWVVRNIEVKSFRILTQAYSRQIGQLPLVHKLPRRTRACRTTVHRTEEETYVQTLDYFVSLSFEEISGLLNKIPPTPEPTPPSSY
jgi:hypothetical protein